MKLVSEKVLKTWREVLSFPVVFTGFLILFIFSGCEQPKLAGMNVRNQRMENGECEIYRSYEPAGIKVIPLTEVVSGENGDNKIEVYISLLDKYGESVKIPAKLRFELYNYVERSDRVKGSRIFMWDDIDITDFEVNSKKWQQHLDAYKFTLELGKGIARGQYVLLCNCTTITGRRISKDYVLDY